MDTRELEGNCGIVELHELGRSSPTSLLEGFATCFVERDETWNEKTGDYDYIYTPKYGLVIFSDIIYKRGRSAGMKLAEYILDNGLGPIQGSPVVQNPNSGNNIQAWVWAPNKRFKEKFCSKD